MQAIRSHQSSESIRMVCHKHFQPIDIKKNGKRMLLKSGAVPTIFEFEGVSSISHDSFTVPKCSNCYDYEEKIAELKKDLLSIRLKNDLECQKWQQKFAVQKNVSDDLKKKLSEEKLKNLRIKKLENEIVKLQQDKYMIFRQKEVDGVSKINQMIWNGYALGVLHVVICYWSILLLVFWSFLCFMFFRICNNSLVSVIICFKHGPNYKR